MILIYFINLNSIWIISLFLSLNLTKLWHITFKRGRILSILLPHWQAIWPRSTAMNPPGVPSQVKVDRITLPRMFWLMPNEGEYLRGYWINFLFHKGWDKMVNILFNVECNMLILGPLLFLIYHIFIYGGGSLIWAGEMFLFGTLCLFILLKWSDLSL